jgi:hypothetical protein
MDMLPPPPPPVRLGRRRLYFDFDDAQDYADNSSLVQNEEGEPSKIPELDEVQTLLVSGLLYGYSLREGKWGMWIRYSVLSNPSHLAN